MRINVSDIIKSDGASLDIKADGIKIDIKDMVIAISDVKFNGSLTNNISKLFLNGEMDVEYKNCCYKCLKDINRVLSIKVKEYFSSLPDENDLHYEIKDNYVDIKKALHDNIVLNLPMKESCSEECKGLCPKCGVVIGNEACKCENEVYLNSQFEILKKIK